MIFLAIFIKIILPIFLIIGLGIWLNRLFSLDLPTLSKLNFYVFVPAVSFIKLLEANVSGAQMGTVGAFALLHTVILFAVAWTIFSHPRFRAQRPVLTMGSIFSNVGNYGIPLVLLAFGNEMIGILAVLIVIQNVLTFTLGVWLFERHLNGPGKVLRNMVKVPVVHGVALALALRGLDLTLPAPIMQPLRYLSDGLVPVALLTLGVQLARTRLAHAKLAVAGISVMRLAVSPLLALVLLPLFHFSAQVAAVIVVASGFPVAVNLFILAAEYRKDEELASQAIFMTTLISGLTLAIWLALLR